MATSWLRMGPALGPLGHQRGPQAWQSLHIPLHNGIGSLPPSDTGLRTARPPLHWLVAPRAHLPGARLPSCTITMKLPFADYMWFIGL